MGASQSKGREGDAWQEPLEHLVQHGGLGALVLQANACMEQRVIPAR
jgi:hypothetical protein